MTKLLFLHNELMMRAVRVSLRLPLHFVTFAYVEGKLFRHMRNQSTFILPHDGDTWSNRYVYGAIFAPTDFSFYIRQLDAYFACSRDALKRNHSKDLHHRHLVPATPISFDTLDDFGRLKYIERDNVECFAYFGNPIHPKVYQRLQGKHSYRIVDGVDKLSFQTLVTEECENERKTTRI